MYFTRDRRGRHSVTNPSQYVSRLARMANQSDVYTALYSDHSKLHSLADKIYIDIDDANLETAYKFARKAEAELETQFGQAPRTDITGNKGFAIYLYFDEVRIDYRAIRELVLELAGRIGITVDQSVLGDKSRVSRLPYTFNFKTVGKGPQPRSCVPVDLSWGFERVLKESNRPEVMLPVTTPRSTGLQSALKELSSKMPELPPSVTYVASSATSDGLIGFLMEDPKRFRNDGRQRIMAFLLIPSLMSKGMSDIEVLSAVQDWVTRAGGSWSSLRPSALNSIRTNRKGPNGDGSVPWGPWSLETFLIRNPDLVAEFFGVVAAK